jgi:hypothetical protein
MVSAYRKELLVMQKALRESENPFVSKEMTEAYEEALEEEISYCDFFVEYHSRILHEKHFSEWVFESKESITPRNSWEQVKGERWTKTNGRMKATIQFDRSGITVGISLRFENDSKAISFYQDSYGHKTPSTHLSNEDSIVKKVEEFKQMAEEEMNQHLNPTQEEREIETLKFLLCV